VDDADGQIPQICEVRASFPHRLLDERIGVCGIDGPVGTYRSRVYYHHVEVLAAQAAPDAYHNRTFGRRVYLPPTPGFGRIRDLAIRDLAIRDLVIRDLRIRDLAIRDLRIRDLAIRDLEIRDLRIRDLVIRDLEIRDLRIRDLVIRDIRERKGYRRLNRG
jgi:hypothetical protein